MAQEIADSKLLDTWGSSGTKIEPDISKIIEGWQLGEQPPHEYMNWLQNTFGSKLNHILKNGVAEWNNETEYLAGASVKHSGVIWLCETTNTNSEPTDLNANWEKVAINKDLTVTVDTLADLKNISYPTNTVWASGYHTKNDGAFGSHIFRLKGVKTTETDNGGTVIIATIGAVDYVYELQYDGAVNVKWFGVTGDGYPKNEGILLNNALLYCRTNNIPLWLGDKDSRIYTTETIDMTGVSVVGTKASIMNFGYSADSSSYGFDILSNVLGLRPTASVFYGLEDRYTNGQMIYSDVANPIVKISNNIKYKNFGVSGWIGNTGQVGIQDPYNATYKGVSFDFDDVRVSGCGGDGVSLENGIEICELKITSTQNYGYGLTTAGGGGDDNQEYTTFKRCNFTMNRLDGVRIVDFKKNIKFDTCVGNSNGWYGLGASAIAKPADQTYIRGMVVIDGVTSSVGKNLIVDNCYGEDCARLVSILTESPLRNVTIENNNIFPTLGLSDTNNHMVYLESTGSSGQIYNLKIKSNSHQNGARGNILHGEMTTTNIIGVEFDAELTTTYDISLFKRIIKEKVLIQNNLELSKHLAVGNANIGDGTAATFTSTYIKDNLRTAGQGQNTYSKGACFLITSNWQATNANNGGAYLFYATVMPSGLIIGSSLAFSSVVGFSAAPTIATDGTLSIPLSAFYRASITRIDMNGERA